MNIIPANQLKVEHTREEIINAFCENLMNRIQKATSDGRHKTCFDASIYYDCISGKIYGTYPDELRGTHRRLDPYKYLLDDYASEVKLKFIKAGYTIKPTGYIGGVWQLTEDICW